MTSRKSKRRCIRTHTFRLGKYRIYEDAPLEGICDVPGDETLTMSIQPGNTRRALSVTLHETMHAERVPDALLHGAGGDAADRIAAFLWRMGWRRTKGK